MAVCADGHEKCETWAREDQCISNPDYMALKCPRSCGHCDCADYDKECAAWAKRGECTRSPMFMKVSPNAWLFEVLFLQSAGCDLLYDHKMVTDHMKIIHLNTITENIFDRSLQNDSLVTVKVHTL